MKHFLASLLLLGGSAWAISPQQAPAARQDQLVAGHEAMPGQIMVRLVPQEYELQRDGEIQFDGELQSFAQSRGLVEARLLLQDQPLDAVALDSGHDRDLLIRFDPSRSIEAELAAWRARPDVESAEADWVVRAATIPNDSYFGQQWAHRNTGQYPAYGTSDCDIDSEQAWDISTGSSDVVIAIIDTGVDLNHPDLQSKIVPGYDFVNNDANADDDHMHGTACASLAAASTNNASGMAGVDWNARIMPLKALDDEGYGSTSDIIASVNWARTNGADVISMSLGGGSYSSTFNTAINNAFSAGIVVVSATGNDNESSISYPAGYANSMAVGALSPCNERKTPSSCDGEWWWGSNYGTGIDVMAPGVLLRSATINGYILNMNGTSGATPHVAGVAGLIRAVNPTLDAAAIRTIIRDSAYDIGDIGYDLQTGYGRLNAYQALLLAAPSDPCDTDLAGPALTHEPLEDLEENGLSYPVSVIATDDCEVEGVQLRWNVGAGWIGVAMLNNSGDTWQASIPAQVAGTTVHYELVATDGSSNSNQSVLANSFVVLDPCLTDMLGPEILHAPLLEDTEDSTGPYPAIFTVTDPCGILVSQFSYRVDGSTWIPEPLDEVDGIFFASIPGQPEGSLVEYQLAAVDGSPNYNASLQQWGFHILNVTPPAAPVVSVSWSGPGQIDLSWTSVADADGYQVWVSMDGGASFTLLADTVELFLPVAVSGDQVRVYQVKSYRN